MQDAISVNNLDTYMETGNPRPLSFCDAIDEAQEALHAAYRLWSKCLTKTDDMRLRMLLGEATRMIEYAEKRL